jgi:hypothetical protein
MPSGSRGPGRPELYWTLTEQEAHCKKLPYWAFFLYCWKNRKRVEMLRKALLALLHGGRDNVAAARFSGGLVEILESTERNRIERAVCGTPHDHLFHAPTEARRRSHRVAPVKPSRSFLQDGPGCRFVRSGPHYIQRFNFPQTAWLYRNVSMEITRMRSPGFETLAVNLLNFAFAEHPTKLVVGYAHPRALELAGALEDLIAEFPVGHWHFPLETLQAWVEEEIGRSGARERE